MSDELEIPAELCKPPSQISSILAPVPEMDPGTVFVQYKELVGGAWEPKEGIFYADKKKTNGTSTTAIEHFLTDGTLRMPGLAVLEPGKFKEVSLTRLDHIAGRVDFNSPKAEASTLHALAALRKFNVNTYHALKGQTTETLAHKYGPTEQYVLTVSQDVFFVAEVAEVQVDGDTFLMERARGYDVKGRWPVQCMCELLDYDHNVPCLDTKTQWETQLHKLI